MIRLNIFWTANPISGTQKLNTFLPVRNGTLLATSSQSTESSMTSNFKRQYATDRHYWICYIYQWFIFKVRPSGVCRWEQKLKVTFLIPMVHHHILYTLSPDILNILHRISVMSRPKIYIDLIHIQGCW